MVTINLSDTISECTNLLNESTQMNYFCIDTKLQIKQVKKLQKCLILIKNIKSALISDGNVSDDVVNLWFSMQCIVNAKINSLQMWINLKLNKLHSAWLHLVDAQSYIKYTSKISLENSEQIENFKQDLYGYEKLLFPPLQFISSGLITSGGKCTICHNDIELCSHIEDSIYRGKVCKKFDQKIVECNHLALVERPRDKGCFINEFQGVDGKYKDTFTHKHIKNKSATGNASAILLREENLDIF